jgi:hypothetical protein
MMGPFLLALLGVLVAAWAIPADSWLVLLTGAVICIGAVIWAERRELG